MSTQRAYKTGVNIKTKNKNHVIVRAKNGVYETKRKNFNKNKLKREPIAELQNSDVVYMLGGMPTYIHSTEAYFRAGVKTAEIEMNKMLSALMHEQQSVMLERANYIDNRWKEALDALGIEGNQQNAFNTFRNLWVRLLNSSSLKTEYLAALMELTKLKQATTVMNEVEKNISEIREELKKEKGTDKKSQVKEFNTKLNKSISHLGLQVSVDFNEKTGKFSYGGDQWNNFKKMVKDTSINAINYALSHTSTQKEIDAITKLMHSHIHTHLIKNNQITGITDYLDSKDIGNLFDIFGTNAMHIDDKDIEDLGARITKVLFEAIAPEKIGESSGRSTKDNKNDALLKIFTQGVECEATITIPISNKTGMIIQRYANNADNKILSFIDRFTASIESAHLDFSNIETSSQISQGQQKNLMALFNYVLRNDAAFVGQQSFVEPFKEMIACYIGWLKIVTEIIGNPVDPLEYSMAIRTPNNLYNTADIMRKFISLNNPLDIIRGEHYMNVTELKKHFYKRGLAGQIDSKGKDIGTLSGGLANYLYAKKRNIISNLVSKNQKVSYHNLYNSDLKTTLQNLSANVLKLPPLKTWFQINLDNVASILDI